MSASPKVTKYQAYHSFMSSYIFIYQLFYIHVIVSYIYVKTMSNVSAWFFPYRNAIAAFIHSLGSKYLN